MDSSLRTRLMWLFGLVLVYKFGVHVPTPGINGVALSEYFNANAKGTIFGLMNMFNGGALQQLSVFGLGIAPYISASIIMQLGTIMFPTIERMQKEGESGRRQITQYTRYLTVLIAIVQGYIISTAIESQFSPVTQSQVVEFPGLGFRLLSTLVLTTGTVFVMWLGEQITEKGIGNGSSIIIFVGIASSITSGASQISTSLSSNQLSLGLLAILLISMLAVVASIVFVEQGQRRIPIQYAKRIVGKKVYGGQDSHLPLRLNSANVIPPIFASTLLVFPATLVGLFNKDLALKVTGWLNPGSMFYEILFVVGIVFFCFFYTAVSTNPNDLAENLRKFGGYVPGIRPGKGTSDYFSQIITRLTFSGAIYLSIVCVLPSVFLEFFGININFGGTSLIILVGVALDTMSQIQAQLLSQNYDGFLKSARLRGRRAV
jgi:preprotein translocase subunit SecY